MCFYLVLWFPGHFPPKKIPFMYIQTSCSPPPMNVHANIININFNILQATKCIDLRLDSRDQKF